MNYALGVTVGDTFEGLAQVVLDLVGWKTLSLLQLMKVLGQINIAELLDEVDVVVMHYCVFQHDYVLMLKLHENGDLPDCS